VKAVSGAKAISFSGHSLGGALAIIAALDLSNRGFPVKNVYVYGAPKLGDEVLENSLVDMVSKGVDVKRFVNDEMGVTDAVPSLPPTQNYCSPRSGLVRLPTKNVVKKSCFGELFNRIKLHSMKVYHGHLKKLIQEVLGTSSTACVSIHDDVAPSRSQSFKKKGDVAPLRSQSFKKNGRR
jgi:hypothetical protein